MEAADPSHKDEDLGHISPRRCPYADKCGYQGVFVWTRLFERHMEKFHKGMPIKAAESSSSSRSV